MTWDGPERRNGGPDHDLLITIANDCKHMKEWTETHTQDDNQRHADNIKKFEQISDNDKWQNKILYGLIGVFVFVEFVSKFFK